MRNYMIRLLCFFAAVICLPPAIGAAAVPADFSTDIGGEPQENCGEEGPKLVAITFDDGPNPITTGQPAAQKRPSSFSANQLMNPSVPKRYRKTVLW